MDKIAFCTVIKFLTKQGEKKTANRFGRGVSGSQGLTPREIHGLQAAQPFPAAWLEHGLSLGCPAEATSSDAVKELENVWWKMPD